MVLISPPTHPHDFIPNLYAAACYELSCFAGRRSFELSIFLVVYGPIYIFAAAGCVFLLRMIYFVLLRFWYARWRINLTEFGREKPLLSPHCPRPSCLLLAAPSRFTSRLSVVADDEPSRGRSGRHRQPALRQMAAAGVAAPALSAPSSSGSGGRLALPEYVKSLLRLTAFLLGMVRFGRANGQTHAWLYGRSEW